MAHILDDSGDLEWLHRSWPELNDGQKQGIRYQLITSGDRGWLARCRKAVRRADVDAIAPWLGTNFPLIGFVPDSRYLSMVRVHFECAWIAADLIRYPVPELTVIEGLVSAAERAAGQLGTAWNQTSDPVGAWNSAVLAKALANRRFTDADANEPTAWSDAVFQCLRPGLLNPDRISLTFLKDLTREMLTPSSSTDAEVPGPALMSGRPPSLSSSVAPALFTRSVGVGEAGTLTMDLLRGGEGEFYPATDMAFVLRKVGSADKPDFRESEITAPLAALATWGEMALQHSETGPTTIRQRWSTHAIRWRLSVPNHVIRELEGPSLGALFALHIGHLLAR